jgi:hypothetical protein
LLIGQGSAKLQALSLKAIVDTFKALVVLIESLAVKFEVSSVETKVVMMIAWWPDAKVANFNGMRLAARLVGCVVDDSGAEVLGDGDLVQDLGCEVQRHDVLRVECGDVHGMIARCEGCQVQGLAPECGVMSFKAWWSTVLVV